MLSPTIELYWDHKGPLPLEVFVPQNYDRIDKAIIQTLERLFGANLFARLRPLTAQPPAALEVTDAELQHIRRAIVADVAQRCG